MPGGSCDAEVAVSRTSPQFPVFLERVSIRELAALIPRAVGTYRARTINLRANINSNANTNTNRCTGLNTSNTISNTNRVMVLCQDL